MLMAHSRNGSSFVIRALGGCLTGQLPEMAKVERFNRALRLYWRLGFREVEDKGVYLLMERAPETG